MKKTTISALILGLLLTVTHVTVAENSSALTATRLTAMFAQSGYDATLTASKGKNHFQLTIENVAPYVTYFSNYPNRHIRMKTVNDFLSDWQKAAKNQQLRVIADLTTQPLNQPNKPSLNLAFKLSKPHYNQKTQTMSYQAELLKPQPHAQVPTKLRHVNLFIDGSWCQDCG